MPPKEEITPTIQDDADYGGIGPEEFERRIIADQEDRYGNIIHSVQWEPVETPDGRPTFER
jgi:hypothetical protein